MVNESKPDADTMPSAEEALVRYYRLWEPYWHFFALAAVVLTIAQVFRGVPSIAFLVLALLILPALMGNMLVQKVEDR